MFSARRFAAPLIWTAYVAWPAHLGGWFHGVPLSPLDALAILGVWWVALADGRSGRVGFVGALLVLTVLASWTVPGEPGFRARYYANAEYREPFERSTEFQSALFTRIDSRLDFAPDRAEFPLAFFNDIGRFNFYNPGEPSRDKLPFAVAWEGNWWVAGDARSHTLYVDAPRASADLIVDGATALSVAPESGSRSANVHLAPGWHRLDIRFSSPYAAPRQFSAGELVDGRRAPFEAASILTRRVSSSLVPLRRALGFLKTAVDTTVIAWLMWVVVGALRKLRREFLVGGPAGVQRRTLTAVFAAFAIGEACIFAAPWARRLMVLLGGDDPLTYEFMARGIQLNGLLYRQLDGPYYYQVLYPYFLAAVHAMFGEGMFGVMLVQRLLAALVAWLLADIAVQLRGEDIWPTAFCVTAFFAYGTFAPTVADHLMNEALFIPLLVAWAACLLRVTRNSRTAPVIATGLLGGFAALARSTTLISWVAVLPACWLSWKSTGRRRALTAALVLPACAVFSFITIRNLIVVHEFIPMPTELPVTLAGGNEPPANLTIDPARHAVLYDRVKLDPLIRRVAEYALTAPGEFARNLGRKAIFALGYYEPYAQGWGLSPVFIAVSCLSAIGIVLAIRSHASPLAAAIPAVIALTQFVAVVIVYPKAERLILPFHTLLVPYASLTLAALLRAGAALPWLASTPATGTPVSGSQTSAAGGRTALGTVALSAAIFAYTLFIRTRGISEHFLMLSDQIRDWSIALGPFSKLPLVGTSSTAGNFSFGPVFYWVLWLSRIAIGPFVENLPHAGGIGLAAIQSCADIVLFLGIRKCSGSVAFALAAVLFVASSPFDMALSSVIWNPVLAVACAKAATGLLLLWQEDLTRFRRAALVMVAWWAVQAHTAALPFAGAVFIWVVASQFQRGVRRLALATLEAVSVVAVLQIPAVFASQSIQPTKLQSVLTQSQELRLLDSFSAMTAAVGGIALTPWQVPQLAVMLLAAGAALCFSYGPFSPPVAITMVPILLSVLMMSAWQEAYDFYWFLTIVPAALLMLIWTSRALPGRRARAIAAVLLLVAAVAAQPRRIASADRVFRMPQYGPLVRGSREVVRTSPVVRRIEAPFLPPLSDSQFVFTILGGHIRPDAPVTARLSESGPVTYDGR